jgi:hypothetical protein
MVPPIQHLHGEAVALSDPSDQDVVRGRLCRTQWPSRKVGRIGLASGSMEKARFRNLSQVPGRICDLHHRTRFFGSPRAGNDKPSVKIGIIIPQCLLHAWTVRRQPYQGLIDKTALARPPSPPPALPPHRVTLPESRPVSIAKQEQQRPGWPGFGFERYQT